MRVCSCQGELLDAFFGQLCPESRFLFPGSPHQVPFVGSRPDIGGTLGHRPSSPLFVCCFTLLREQTGIAAHVVSVFLQPPATHSAEGSKALAGEKRDGYTAVEPETPLFPSIARPDVALSSP